MSQNHSTEWKLDLDNNDRAEMAQNAITAFADAYYGKMPDGQPSEEDETILGDLLCDIRHYCDAKGFDFHKLVDGSYQTYAEEVQQDGGPATRVGELDDDEADQIAEDKHAAQMADMEPSVISENEDDGEPD